MIRQPIVVVLGHVDSGKTTLLDKIRGTALQLREAGGMIRNHSSDATLSTSGLASSQAV